MQKSYHAHLHFANKLIKKPLIKDVWKDIINRTGLGLIAFLLMVMVKCIDYADTKRHSL